MLGRKLPVMAWHVHINSRTQALRINTCTQNRAPGKNHDSTGAVYPCQSPTGHDGAPVFSYMLPAAVLKLQLCSR